MPESVFSMDEYFKLLEEWLTPPVMASETAILQRQLQDFLKKRQQFGIEMPRPDNSRFGVS